MERILAPDEQLRNIKLIAYFDLIEEFQKYRKLKIYRLVDYPITNWVNSLLTFYDVMFAETIEEQYKIKYGELFERLQELNHKEIISYEELLNLTREIMSFASEVGITKMSKHDDSGPGDEIGY